MLNGIGNKIKQLREERNIPAGEVASASNIDTNKLQHIEDGKSNPSMSTLVKIARRLGVRPGTILDGSEEANPVVTTAKDGGVALSHANNLGEERSNMSFISLAQNKKDRNMEPYIITVSYTVAAAPAGKGEASSHEGEEFLYVLEGEVEIRYGNKTYSLGEGDSIYYDSVVPHVVSSAAPNTTAKVLAVTYAPF